MTKQDFINLGVPEDLASSCEIASLDELSSFVPVSSFDEQALQVNSLSKNLENLQLEYKSIQESHSTDIHKINVDNAVNLALIKANAINPLTVLPLLSGIESADFDDDGNLVGLAKQIESLSLAEDTKFLFNSSPSPKIRGAFVGESGNDDCELSSLSYSGISKMMEQNPNLNLNL